MDRLRDFFGTHWFSSLLIGVALFLGLLLWRRRQRGDWSPPLLLAGSALALAGLGGLATAGDTPVVPFAVAFWLSAAAALALFGAFLVTVVTGRWWAPAGYALAAVLVLGLGGVCAPAVGDGLVAAGKALLNVEVVEPVWLVLLALVPAVVFMSYRSLAGLGPVRRWLAIGLRCALVILLALALAEVRLRHPNENVTVLFLVDRSLSVPKEPAPDPTNPNRQIDLRWERVKRFINEAVEDRGPGHKEDRAGVIVFGRRPRLELPPAEVKRLNFHDIISPIDNTYTDIGGAIKMALASFPEGTGKRIVLISDGNENLGNAEEQARIAKNNGVQIDVVPLAPGYRNENEVLVQSVEAPPVTTQSAQVPIRVLIRSYNPNRVRGTLTLKQITQALDKNGKIVPVINPVAEPQTVVVPPGLSSFTFKQTLADKDQSYTYEAIFTPTAVVDERGQIVSEGLPDDRTENNRATTHVIAQGQRRMLLVEPKDGDHLRLLTNLRALGKRESKFRVDSIEAAKLPQDKEELGVFLSKYDCLILGNVPADLLNEDQQEMIRSNTHEQGCGLIMIGGPESFGAGGWQGTPVEKALPVDCDIKSIKVQGKGGLVLIMHASEMADGNVWQKKIVQLAINKLSPMDEVGIIQFSWGVTKYHLPLQVIGSKRGAMLKIVDSMVPEDMPEFDTGIAMAYKDLTDPKRELSTRHVIIISDGDPVCQNMQQLQKMRQNPKVTVTTVGVATHGAPQDQTLSNIAKATGGRFYSVKSPKALPAIYIKETRLVSQSFVYEKRFQPKLLFKSGPTEKLPDDLPPLWGYVRTTPKPVATVQIPILAPAVGGQEFPILAFWHYGLGKSVAFTSDARSQEDKPFWDRDWAGSEMYVKFWEQTLDWALRAVETGKLTMTTEYRDGKVRVIVDARDSSNRPLTDLKLRGGVTTPIERDGGAQAAPQIGPLKFEQKNSGLYEATFKADEAGSYIINAQAQQMVTKEINGKKVDVQEGIDSVRAGVTIPYSPEFSDLESNPRLLEGLATLTGGNVYKDKDTSLAEAAHAGVVFRLSGLPPAKNLQPVWYWLLLLAGIGFLFDVAVRRLAIDSAQVAGAVQRGWLYLRGRAAVVAAAPQFLDRLKTRKAQVAETLERSRGARRFEAPVETTATAAPLGAHEMPEAQRPAPRPTAQPRIEPKREEPADDYASRLMNAKKRVWEERDK
jgi:uncharacterized membrane protein